MHSVLVLGGYGFFGARIAAGLAREPAIRLLIGGRDVVKARQQAAVLGLPARHALAIDAASAGFARALRAAGVDTLIHTAGPFQEQDNAVARAAIEARCHYIDLADGRAFVAGIGALDEAARGAGVCVISGASSVPGLSSAVIERFRPAFEALDEIHIGIGSGGRAPGLATMRAVFGYCGKPFRRLENGAWIDTHGWLDLQRHRFPPPVGARWLGSCDVPDLELFPAHYAPLRTVRFHAGVAGAGHFAVWLGAGLVKLGVLRSMAPFAAALHRLSRWIEPMVSDCSAMFVQLRGRGRNGQPLNKTWTLIAERNHGPQVPCGASIALARKLAQGAAPRTGAYPCVGLLSVEEYLSALGDLAIREVPPDE